MFVHMLHTNNFACYWIIKSQLLNGTRNTKGESMWPLSYTIVTHVNSLRPHLCISNVTIIGTDNGLSPVRRQAIIGTKTGILVIGPLGTNVRENWFEIRTFSFKKIYFEMSGNWRPFRLGLNMLIHIGLLDSRYIRLAIVLAHITSSVLPLHTLTNGKCHCNPLEIMKSKI